MLNYFHRVYTSFLCLLVVAFLWFITCGLTPWRIYDIASGHGLLAVLLAYRFPKMTVVALDREKRDGFVHYVPRLFFLPEHRWHSPFFGGDGCKKNAHGISWTCKSCSNTVFYLFNDIFRMIHTVD